MLVRPRLAAGFAFLMGALSVHETRAQDGERSKEWRNGLDPVSWRIKGELLAPENISAIARISEDRFLIGSDDTGSVQGGIIDSEKRMLTIKETLRLLDEDDDDEIDIEAIAAAPDESRYYITGSHSLTKKGQHEQGAPLRVPVGSQQGRFKNSTERRPGARA